MVSNELKTGFKYNECRRYPPASIGDGEFDFPGVKCEDWCGEYEEVPDDNVCSEPK